MKTLVIDSATEACSVALLEGTVLIAGECRMLGRGHAEQLVPMIAALPGKGHAHRIAVSRGPGSFTGVRVGLAAARALAFAWQAELVGYPTLALVAAMALDRQDADGVTVCATGGHGEWFVQDFADDGTAVTALCALRPEAAAARPSKQVVAGSQAEALVALRGHGAALPMLPDARAFPLLGASHVSADTTPLYGRAPDARLPGTA